jgi:hypothetical protein
MAFFICKKCKAGARTDVGEATLKALGFTVTGPHRSGECDGEVEIVTDQQAGAGPNYVPPRKRHSRPN